MSTSTDSGLTSIIVPCCNQVDFTQLCFQALFRFTRPAWELIVVDNGSTDGTALYLAGVRDAAPVPVTLISNAQNLGFPRAINQGLEVASGEDLVLLNNGSAGVRPSFPGPRVRPSVGRIAGLHASTLP
jgi:GT2 family glycosyltransferase